MTVPEDIKALAESIAADVPIRVQAANRMFIAAVIARALFAERQRAVAYHEAKAAELFEMDDDDGSVGVAYTVHLSPPLLYEDNHERT